MPKLKQCKTNKSNSMSLQKSFVIPKAEKRKAEEAPKPPPPSKQPKTEPQATFQRQFLEAVGGGEVSKL